MVHPSFAALVRFTIVASCVAAPVGACAVHEDVGRDPHYVEHREDHPADHPGDHPADHPADHSNDHPEQQQHPEDHPH